MRQITGDVSQATSACAWPAIARKRAPSPPLTRTGAPRPDRGAPRAAPAPRPTRVASCVAGGEGVQPSLGLNDEVLDLLDALERAGAESKDLVDADELERLAGGG